MIDTSKKYTYNGKPVRIYADGSDTDCSNIHGAWLSSDGKWMLEEFGESDLVEVWEPKEGELCYFWSDRYNNLIVSKYFRFHKEERKQYETPEGTQYQYCAPFKGELPEAFKGLCDD